MSFFVGENGFNKKTNAKFKEIDNTYIIDINITRL